MTTHFVKYAIKGGTAYWMLNEAAEKSNDVLKRRCELLAVGRESRLAVQGVMFSLRCYVGSGYVMC